jgi:tetratricopeptide (TPR) repeat protein
MTDTLLAKTARLAGTWDTDGVSVTVDEPVADTLTFGRFHAVFESELAAAEALSLSPTELSGVLATAEWPATDLNDVVRKAHGAVTDAAPDAEPLARRAAVIRALGAVCETMARTADEAFLEEVATLTDTDPLDPAGFRESAAFLAACLDATVTEPGLSLPHERDTSQRFHGTYYADRGDDERASEAFEAAIDDIGAGPLEHLWYARYHDRRGSPGLARVYFESGFELHAEGFGVSTLDPLVPALVRFVELLDAAGEDADAVRWAEFALDRKEAISAHTDALDWLATRVETGTLPPARNETGVFDADPDAAPPTVDADDWAGLFERQVAAAVERDAGDCDPDELAAMGDQYRTTELPELARAYYERALESAPDHGGAHFGLGMLAYRAKNSDEETARTHFERAIEADPDSLRFRRRYADALACWGDREAAHQAFGATLAVAPRDPMTNCWFGSYCKAWDEDATARRHYEIGVAAADDTDDVGLVPLVSWIADLVELCERDGDTDAVVRWCRHGLSLCDREVLLAFDDQETIEETLATYVDSVPTPQNRRDEEPFDHYWVLSVTGQDANVIVTVDGEEIESTSDGASFAMSLPLNHDVGRPPYDIEVTVLRATAETTDEARVLSGPEEASVDVRLKRYQAGEIVSTHDADPDAEASYAGEPLPATVRLAFDPEQDG